MGAMTKVIVAGAAAAVVATAGTQPAAANGPDESDEARQLVLQGIALIVNAPDETHEIEERIEHALEAPHAEGVDLDLVREAAALLHDEDLHQVRDMLQNSIGAGPPVNHGDLEPIRETSGEPGLPAYAVGAQTGTVVVLDEYQLSSTWGWGEIVLLALAAVAILAGGLLSWRSRSPESVRQLRETTGRREEA